MQAAAGLLAYCVVSKNFELVVLPLLRTPVCLLSIYAISCVSPIGLAPVALQVVCHIFPTVTMMASDGANVEFDVNMDSIDLAIYLKDKGIPDEVCDKLEGKSMYEITSVKKY